MMDIAQVKADYSRSQDTIYTSPHCPVPKHRLIEYRRAIAHIPALLAEIERLKEQ